MDNDKLNAKCKTTAVEMMDECGFYTQSHNIDPDTLTRTPRKSQDDPNEELKSMIGYRAIADILELNDKINADFIESSVADSGDGTTGVMIFYINIEDLSSIRVSRCICEVKSRLNETGFLDRIKRRGVDVLFVPVRGKETVVEYLPL